jgi:hypothetical protein
MAQRTAAGYKTVADSRFADNTTGLIEEIDHRDQHTDAADSFLNKTDGGTVTGNIGIGSAVTANAPLQFASGVNNRKIVLNETANNDHQFIGLGINSDTFRYQVAATMDSHVWYAGTSTTTSSELMRLTGAGRLGVGLTPTAVLHLKAGTAAANTAPLKLTTGTALTTTEDGALEYHSSHLYFTIGTTRHQLDQQGSDSFFTPTLTNITNLTASTAYEAYYLKVGTKVTVFGQVDIQATALGVIVLGMSFPVAVTTIFAHQASGTVSSGNNEETGHIGADDINLRAQLTLTATTTTNHRIYYHYSYLVT